MALPPVTVADTLQHPSFPSAVWNLEPTSSGLLPVAEGRGGPFNLSWEVHGSGPAKLLLVMGLGGFKTAWQRQTLHFGHRHADRYSVLLIDNRGMGDSDKPLMRYSTSEMARDVLEVLAHLGWVAGTGNNTRQVHVAGISMGGMIAQELALLAPDALSSLTLVCTAAAIENTTSFAENLAERTSLLVPKSIESAVQSTARRLFPAAWLAGPDDVDLPDPTSGAPGVGPPRGFDGESYPRFGSRYQRFVAEEMHKRGDRQRFGLRGFLLQLVAAGWHHKSAEQLRQLGDGVGRERILVMHGTDDGMISVPHGRKLIAQLQPAVGQIIDGMGHAPIVERYDWFNRTLEERIVVGEGLDRRQEVE